jgi:hypothetical protein
MLEARVAIARAACGIGVGVLQVIEHRGDRAVQAVEVESVEADPRRGVAFTVVRAQPVDERTHLGVAPHPCREPFEAGERGVCIGILAIAPHVAVHAVRIGPVSLDRHRGEAFFPDEAARDLGAHCVELVRAVRGFADEHDACAADALEQRVVIARRAGERVRGAAHGFDKLDFGSGIASAHLRLRCDARASRAGVPGMLDASR